MKRLSFFTKTVDYLGYANLPAINGHVFKIGVHRLTVVDVNTSNSIETDLQALFKAKLDEVSISLKLKPKGKSKQFECKIKLGKSNTAINANGLRVDVNINRNDFIDAYSIEQELYASILHVIDRNSVEFETALDDRLANHLQLGGHTAVEFGLKLINVNHTKISDGVGYDKLFKGSSTAEVRNIPTRNIGKRNWKFWGVFVYNDDYPSNASKVINGKILPNVVFSLFFSANSIVRIIDIEISNSFSVSNDTGHSLLLKIDKQTFDELLAQHNNNFIEALVAVLQRKQRFIAKQMR